VPVWTLAYYAKAEMEKAIEEDRMMPVEADRRLVVTPGHPFWVKGKGWVQVQDLGPDDELELGDGQSAVILFVSPLYRTETPEVVWQEGMFYPEHGHLVDLRNGISEYVDPSPQYLDQPQYLQRRDEACYYRTTVYNFEVEDFHTYYVGSLPVWVCQGDSS
jgi:hypothetical protein